MPDVLGAKGIELLREALPGIARMGTLYQGDNPGAVVVVNGLSRGFAIRSASAASSRCRPEG